MPASPFDPATLTAIILDRFPELEGASFGLLAAGWDSVAVDADNRFIFKFPRHARGEAALRREVAILGLVAGAVSMRVPSLELFSEPRTFSRHAKIPGDHLLGVSYEQLEGSAKEQLGRALGTFYAQLHAITPSEAIAAGARPIEQWLDAREIWKRIKPVLPDTLWPFARKTLARWSELAPDPFPPVYGFFDGHGWNMAFDHAAGRLNGLYDFADSGIGPMHQEFVYSNLISPDLTERVIAAYEREAGCSIDRDRVDVLTATHRLWELAMEAHMPDHVPALVETVRCWADRPL